MIKPFLMNTVSNDVILDRCKAMKIELEESPYTFQGKKIPRVTSILSDMLAEEFLLAWANGVGLYQRKSYLYYRKKATDIGSAVHEAIQRYITNRQMPNFNQFTSKADSDKAKNSFKAFLDWWAVIEKNDYEIILEEAPMVTPYCGGTLDLFIRINGKNYLVDFKTSTKLSFKYYLQLAAYRRMIYDSYGMICDGCMLVRLDKKIAKYQEVMLDLSNYDDLKFMNDCDNAFISLLYAYYNRANIENNELYVGGQ